MYYINAKRLLLLCVAHEVLCMDEQGNIPIYREAGKDPIQNPEGWYLENIEDICQELMRDTEGQRQLREALETKGISFTEMILPPG